jgi:DNA-binding NarL/FixJ family response regulator
MTIRILLADDQNILRKGLRSLFETREGYEIIGEAENGVEAKTLARQLQPDIILMDITMPIMNGIEATENIMLLDASIKIIALSVHSDKRFIEKVIGAGAKGYLRKDCDFDELLYAIKTVLAGNQYISPNLGGGKGSTVTPKTVAQPPEQPLSSRERQVLVCVAQGKTTKEIADELNLSAKSIERYRQTVMEKLNLHTIADLTRYAISEGLIPED